MSSCNPDGLGLEDPQIDWNDVCRANQHLISAPSGIAKLRESTDVSSNTPDPDAMNIDDFIFPTSIASPAGISTSPPTPPSHATASAIPIQTRKDAQENSHPNFPPSAPANDGMRNHEFDYVQRRVRKTSIDETKVCLRAEVEGHNLNLLSCL